MKELFHPKAVAVIGASEDLNNPARGIVENLLEFQFKGEIFLVGRKPGVLFGKTIFTSLDDFKEKVDSAVILTPAPTVPGMLESCGRKGVRWAIIETGGFGEYSEEGAEIGKEALRIARKWEIRIVGPNGLGLLNVHNGFVVPLASLKREFLRKGNVSILSQSGGVAFSYLDLFSSANVGVAKVVSMGNKLDLNEIDYLKYLVRDPQTEIIGLYVESLERGRELCDIARTTSKPIILHKGNIGGESEHIAKLHTAALATDDVVVDAALKQAGIIRVRDFRTFLDVIKIFTLPPIKGDKLVVISRSGGVAIVASDSAERHGLQLFPVTKTFQNRIHSLLSSKYVQLTNPIDCGGVFHSDLYTRIFERLFKINGVDGVIALLGPTTEKEIEYSRIMVSSMKELSHRYQKPGLAISYYMREQLSPVKRAVEYPIFDDIDAAIGALAISRNHHRRRGGLEEKRFDFPARRARVRSILQRAWKEDRNPLLSETMEILNAYGISTADFRVIDDKRKLGKAVKEMGTPLALKIVSAEISHKSDVGGVILNVGGLSEAEEAYDEIRKLSSSASASVLVQKMVPGGKEVILGGKRDASFGPIVLFGVGGIYTEIFKESSMRVAPINRLEAEEMISESRAANILRGARGERPLDVDAVVENLLRLSQLMIDFPEIEGIDVNPVKVLEKGAVPVDARLLLNHNSREKPSTLG